MAAEVRAIHEDELAAFLGTVRTAMLAPPTDDEVESRREVLDVGRMLAAFDEGVLCGTARSFPTRLTVPGGAVDAAAVSSVGVLPTHRRRGHLTRLMAAQLADVAARGEPVAILVAAEWPIYGRYGYGPATEACRVRLDARAMFRHPATGSTTLEAPEPFAKALAEVYEGATRRTPGHMTWQPPFVEMWAGARPSHDGQDDERKRTTRVVWRDDAGTAQGVAAYTVSEDWADNRPNGTVSTAVLTAATDEAQRELYRFLASVDWASTVLANLCPVDDPLPFHLVDGRDAVLDQRYDHVWARLVDVPAALSARSYAAEGSLVVGVTDPWGFAQGRFALDAGPVATCARTDRSPDLSVPAEALGAAYLGGHSWRRLAAAGLVAEHRPGVVDRATALFATPRAPYCSTPF